MILQLGGLPVVAILIMVAISFGIGHFLGGSSAEGRATLGIACSVGLALFIAALNSVDHEVIPTLVAYMILGAIVAIPCSLWSNRQLAQSK